MKGSQTLLESALQQFFHIFLSLWENLVSKISLLVISIILALFVHTLTADEKCSLCNKHNLQKLIQMELCKKQKLFFKFSTASFKFTFNFKHFEK